MARHPTLGVKDSKPRLSKEPTNGKPNGGTGLDELSREYLVQRNRLQRTKAHEAAVAAAYRRGQLIEKEFVADQARYLMVVFRRRVLLAPATWARKIAAGNEGVNEHAVARILDAGVRELLSDLRTLPARITDERWADHLEDGDGS
jgi:hypothetical protein